MTQTPITSLVNLDADLWESRGRCSALVDLATDETVLALDVILRGQGDCCCQQDGGGMPAHHGPRISLFTGQGLLTKDRSPSWMTMHPRAESSQFCLFANLANLPALAPARSVHLFGSNASKLSSLLSQGPRRGDSWALLIFASRRISPPASPFVGGTRPDSREEKLGRRRTTDNIRRCRAPPSVPSRASMGGKNYFVLLFVFVCCEAWHSVGGPKEHCLHKTANIQASRFPFSSPTPIVKHGYSRSSHCVGCHGRQPRPRPDDQGQWQGSP